MPKVAKKLRIKPGDSIGKSKEQQIKLMPKRFKLEQCPTVKGVRQKRIEENQVLSTDGEVGKMRLRRDNKKSVRRHLLLGVSEPKKQNRVFANKEKCHPDTEKRWESPLLLKSSFCL